MIQAFENGCPRCQPNAQKAAAAPTPAFKPTPPKPPLKMQQPREPLTPIQLGVGILLVVGMFSLLVQFKSWRQDLRARQNEKMYAPFSMGAPNANSSVPNAGPGQFPQNNAGPGNPGFGGQPLQVSGQSGVDAARQRADEAQARMNDMHNQSMERMQSHQPGGMGPGPMGRVGPGGRF
ncbi:MAG: hypothetical protein ABJA67_03940 [Chthonomonadales bacterium]